MQRGPTGKYETVNDRGQRFSAFVPVPLPPDPPVVMDGALLEKFADALTAVGGLNTLSINLPNADMLIYSYLRKEAVLSSQIEGTQSSLPDLLMLEMGQRPDDAPIDDTQETINYLNALRYATERLDEGAPIDATLIQEIHHRLLQSGRGSSKQPGEFRDRQNYITRTTGRVVFIPPPHNQVGDCMADLVHYIAGDGPRSEATHPLIRAGTAHAQFETIHPFRDGNGRVGRMIVLLMLLESGLLSVPTLYLSLRLKDERRRYGELLNDVRFEGDWEGWLSFFFEAIKDAADAVIESTTQLSNLFADDRIRIEQTGRRRFTALQVHDILMEQPYVRINDVLARTQLSRPGADAGIRTLGSLGIVREVTGNARNRVFAYDSYMEVLATGTEPY